LSAAGVALVAALVLGLLYWVLASIAGVLTLRRVPRLDEWPLPADARWPSLSVVSPACDEAATLRAATQDRLASDYPGVEFVLVDDRSRDGTGAIVDELAAADPRVRALHVRELPEGWLGKVYAMETGLHAARGEWILLSDADVHFAPDALRRAVALAQDRGLDHLAVMPHLLPTALLLDAAVSNFGRHFMLAVRPWAVENPKSSASVGVGAFNLVRRAALERVGGLRRLRLSVADDVSLGILLKTSGARQGLAISRRAVWLRWYDSLGAMARGLEKGLFAYAGRCEAWRLLLFGALVLFLDLSPWLALLLPHGLPWLHVAGGVMAAAAVVGAALGERWAGRAMHAALLQPVGSLLFAWIVLRAAVVGGRRGGVLWRGTLYRSELLREAMSWEKGWRGGVPRE
jgi:cellulose synthase/poly-beta-1,6-N-acetylglucosamine synthase-like glycosyltransferase